MAQKQISECFSSESPQGNDGDGGRSASLKRNRRQGRLRGDERGRYAFYKVAQGHPDRPQ